jgi:hypothetical protein
MTDDDRLLHLLRSALPRSTGQLPSRDLWPLVVKQMQAPAERSWFDIGMAAVVAILLTLFPEWLLLLVYHL